MTLYNAVVAFERLQCVTLSLAAALGGAPDKAPPAGRASNDNVEIVARAYPDKDSIRRLLGAAMVEGVLVIELTLTPKGGQPLAITRDDFTLRSDRDGQKAQPFAPSQIAGRGALVVSTAPGGGGVMGDESGPIWGGGPGTGERPRRLGGEGASMGNTSQSGVAAAVDSGGREKDNPLLEILKKRVFAESTESAAPVSGLLYFPLEGKHKPKDLELTYRGAAGKLTLRFK